MNDPSELKFALADFGFKLSEEDYYRFRQQMFVASFCGYNLITQSEDYNMWRFYGRDGFGAALVFEVENYSSEWNHYAFGKVQYSNKNESFEKLKQMAEYYNSSKGAFSAIPSFLVMMCMLHKHQVWEIENEYRLFAGCNYNDKDFKQNIPIANYFLWSTLNHYITDKGDKGAFTCLPLYTNYLREEMKLKLKDYNIEGYFEMFPHIKIKQAILGYNVSESKLNKIIDYGSKLANVKLGYTVEFIESKFTRELK